MNMNKNQSLTPKSNSLFERVVTILERARTNAVGSVNSEMVLAYWLIGREIVQEIQKGEDRAEYGKQLIAELSKRLNNRYGKGFSTTNLRYFRTFYQTYSERRPEIRHIACGESETSEKRHTACGVLEEISLALEKPDLIRGFSSNLGWSHYRALMKVVHKNERLFYEIEAEKEGWSVSHLERQIHTHLFARLLKSRDKAGVMELTRDRHMLQEPADAVKDPYVLDFLGLPDAQRLHESDIESAIINNLQSFLLELGKGFAFVSRQKRLQFGDTFFYVDLVSIIAFFNVTCLLI